jgi:hypothetical protein
MRCEELHGRLIAQLCGEIEDEDAAQLQQHLSQCEECAREQKEFRAMLGLMKQLPVPKWEEKLRIRDLLRRDQKWRAIVFSKAALWFLALTAFITVISTLPLHWELSAHQFSVRWGKESTDTMDELKKLQLQLAGIEKQNQQFYQVSENRMKQIVEQKNIEQQQRYWETMKLFTNYLQLQRAADLQKLQREIATTYDRTGHEVERTNELLEGVLRTSAEGTPLYDSN